MPGCCGSRRLKWGVCPRNPDPNLGLGVTPACPAVWIVFEGREGMLRWSHGVLYCAFVMHVLRVALVLLCCLLCKRWGELTELVSLVLGLTDWSLFEGTV